MVPESLPIFMQPQKVSMTGIDIPILYIKMNQDKALPLDIQEKVISIIHPDDVVIMEGCHMPMYAQPTKLADVIDDWIKKIRDV